MTTTAKPTARTTLTPAQQTLAMNARAVSVDIDRGRWLLAEMADDAEEKGTPAWAEIIGSACRRSPSTVYGWRRAYRLRKSVNPASRLEISFWLSAADAIDPERPEPIIDWLATCEADPTITIESARANMPRKETRPPAPPPLSDAIQTAVAVLVDLSERRDIPAPARVFVEQAVKALRLALGKLAGEAVN